MRKRIMRVSATRAALPMVLGMLSVSASATPGDDCTSDFSPVKTVEAGVAQVVIERETSPRNVTDLKIFPSA